MSKAGDTEFRNRLLNADHISIMENWTGWSVHANLTRGDRFITVHDIGPFPTMRAASAWLRSWVGDSRLLKRVDAGSYHWWKDTP